MHVIENGLFCTLEQHFEQIASISFKHYPLFQNTFKLNTFFRIDDLTNFDFAIHFDVHPLWDHRRLICTLEQRFERIASIVPKLV